MIAPKFIRKAILQIVGLELPIEKKSPIRRDQMIGFSEDEIDEIVLGSSHPRIKELREYILDNIDVAFPQEKQAATLRKMINSAFDRYTKEEAQARII